MPGANTRWEPQIGWQAGMREMVAWGRKYLARLETLPFRGDDNRGE